LPIEVIDSLKLLAQARVRLIEAITRFNQAQFALFVALGSPPPIDPAATALTPPPPIATPLHSPIVMPKPEPMPYVQASAPPVLGK
jgi:outer membrane protein TolC